MKCGCRTRPSSIVAVWRSEILAKANSESTVTGIPSFSMMRRTRTGEPNEVSREWPGAILRSLARNFSRTSRSKSQGFDGDPPLREQVVQRAVCSAFLTHTSWPDGPRASAISSPPPRKRSVCTVSLSSNTYPSRSAICLLYQPSSWSSSPAPPDFVQGGSVTLAGQARSSATLVSTIFRYSAPISYHWPCQ